MYSFPWDNNELVEKKYRENNYIIDETGSDSGKAIVFFSSHGIYFPNSEEAFYEKMIVDDYYDWRNISKHKLIQKYFSKIVFVRDVYKQWYVTGINNKIDSINKLRDFLKKETFGYEVTTCGSSAGGYMALLMGVLLDAERIIDSCGQHDLLLHDFNPLIDKYLNDKSRSRYYRLKPYLQGHEDNIYYFYPAQCDYDIEQSLAVGDSITKRFAMRGTKHGETIRTICFPYVLTMNREKLDFLQKKYEGQDINRADLFKDIVPVKDRIAYYFRYGMKKMFHKEEAP